MFVAGTSMWSIAHGAIEQPSFANALTILEFFP